MSDQEPPLDPAILKVMRSDLPDEEKRRLVELLIAEREAARPRTEQLAAQLTGEQNFEAKVDETIRLILEAEDRLRGRD